MYGANEVNNHNFTFESVLNLPLPLFYDYIGYQVSEKKKVIEKQNREAVKMKS